MSSHQGEDENVRFTGKNAEEAEDFIHAVNRRAWAAGKQRDYTWMADFAYACFTKKALRWYEDLDEETQNDWRLLKRAILAKYATPPQSPSIIPSSASASGSPTVSVGSAPAAPPPTFTTVQRGRIRIDHGGNGVSTYIAIPGANIIAPGGNEIACMQAANGSDACVFEFDTIRRTITLQDGGVRLIVRGDRANWSLEPSKQVGSQVEYGGLFGTSSSSSSKPVWLGTKWDDIWSVAPDGKVVASLKRSDGGLFNLEAATASGTPPTVFLHSDINAFINYYGSQTYHAVTLYFEPLP